MLLTKDFLGGVLFVCLGLGAMAIAATYPIGAATRMGPGYFPLMIGTLILVLGLALAIRAAIKPSPADRLVRVRLQPLFFILAAIAAFALLIDSWGLIVAVAALTLIARLSRIEGRLVELVVLVVLLNVIAFLVFVYGLEMPLPVSPW